MIVGVAIRDFSLCLRVAQRLKDLEVPFLMVSGSVPGDAGVLLTTKETMIDFPEENTVIVSAQSVDRSIDTALRKLAGNPAQLVVGIDPGEQPGIAIVGDGRVIRTLTARSPEAVPSAVGRAISAYHVPAIVRVGHGARLFRNRIINALQASGLSLPIEVVDESGTTQAHASDEESAIGIALTEGREVLDTREVKPTLGEIKDIQRRSRRLSGTITISRSLATRVALGEMSLEEALRASRCKEH